ncbi:MAG: glycosyltransferase involved in cell wall biosynthesis [Pontimonas sp.]
MVICTFNGERFLASQLESILAQTLLPEEIIVSDDGSTDRTLEMVREISTASSVAKSIRWIISSRKAPFGPAKNFEQALRRASHGLIALADQDDVWLPEKLEVLAHRLRTEPSAMLVHSDARLTDGRGISGPTLMKTLGATRTELRNLENGRGLAALMRRNLVTGATVMIRRELLEQASPFPDAWMHDEWLGLVAALQGTLVFEKRTLVEYRQHGNNAIGASKTTMSAARSRLEEDRGTFFDHKNLRNVVLVGLVSEPPAWLTTANRAVLAGKISHERWRMGLKSVRVMRIIPVLFRGLRGFYSVYSRGPLDMIRDIALRDAKS